MDIEFQRVKRPIWAKPGFYAAVLLGVFAIAVGSYAAMRKSMTPMETPTQSKAFALTEEPLDVVIPQTERITVTEPAAAQTEPTTAADNLPFTGSFSLPLSTEILKDYSDGEMVYSNTMNDWRVHNGIDFTGRKDSEVRAVQRGTIRAVYEDELWGTVVEIDHGNEMIAKYCGLTKASAPAVGAEVRKGQEIGRLGTVPVESADEPHLHFEVTVNGKTVDPLAAINHAE